MFVTRDVLTSSVAFGELWGIPLANGADARALVRYPGYATPFLTSRLSPDGTRYAFALDRGDGVRRIAIANLTDGSMSWLRTDDTNASDAEPAWDPSGTRIAFARSEGGPSSQGSVWVVNVDGPGLKRLVPPAAAPVFVHQWTPDGRQVAFHRDVGYEVVDVATDVRVHMDNVLSADASWRSRPPALLAHGLASVVGSDQQSIFTADAPAGARNVLVRGTSLNDPRWRPGADEFLYVFFDDRTLQADLRVRSLSGAESVLPVSGGSPTWTTDGSAIAYIRGESVQLPGTGEGAQRVGVLAEIRVIDADGTGDRMLYRSSTFAGQLPPNWCVCVDALATRWF